MRAELMRASAAIAVVWERTARGPRARALAELAEQQAVSEAIGSRGQSW